jgi:hypothetical protein
MRDIPETLSDDRIDQCWEDFTSNLKCERDQWRECAKRLAGSIAIAPLVPTNSMKAALAEFDRLKEVKA